MRAVFLQDIGCILWTTLCLVGCVVYTRTDVSIFTSSHLHHLGLGCRPQSWEEVVVVEVVVVVEDERDVVEMMQIV